jgi:uncharacterized protein YbcI
MGQATKFNVRRHRLRQRLHHALEKLWADQIGGSGNIEIKIVDDLILLRCKEALSPSEANVATLKAGRFLLQEMSERLCRELQPNLNTHLYEITGLRLLDICVGLFVERRVKIYLFIMSGAVKE